MIRRTPTRSQRSAAHRSIARAMSADSVPGALQAFLLVALLFLAPQAKAQAQNFSYPVQEFRLGIGNSDRNVVVSATTAGAALTSSGTTGLRTEKWYLNYVSAGVYEIASSQTGLVITNQGGVAVTATDVDGANQRWKIVSVAKDFEGFDLYYKIVSNADANLALSFATSGNAINVSTYSGATFQKFKLNLDGLEGFAGNSLAGGKEKAGTIGGLLGATKSVSTVAQLVDALNSTDPMTVVVTANLDMVNQGKDAQRIRDNKTLVGSYAANTIYDCQLRNDDFNGADAAPSNNIVIRNLNLVARTLNSTNSGVILIYIYGGRNVWVDHNDFSATFAQNKDAEVGKFMWINTPSASWSDGKYNGINPDYITISYNYLLNRFWTLAFGSQNKDVSRLRTTLMFNKWEQCSRRTPQYSNGFHHNYGEYHTVTGSGNANASSQVIAGEGSRVLSENCRFEAYTGKEFDIDRSLALSFFDYNSYTSSAVGGAPSKISVASLGTSWKASDNYGYTLVSGYASSGNDVKAFTNAYSGCFKSYAAIKYVTDADVSKYVSAKYAAPFLVSVEVDSLKAGSVLDTAFKYALKNVNSGHFLSLSGVAAVGTSVVQSDSAQTWKLADAGEGYYTLAPQGSSLRLDVAGGSTVNGTAIDLASSASSTAQKFKFVDNGDGSYTIATQVSKDASCIGIAAAAATSGSAAVEWASTGSKDQKWILEAKVDPIQGTLIKNLVVADLENHGDWKIAGNTQVGSLVYGDRTFTFATLPQELLGSEAILAACDSKASTSDLATFVAGADITVFVALDARVTTLPAWLATWTATELGASSSNDAIFTLYKASFQRGDTIVLGTNGQSAGCLNYAVFAIPSGTTLVRGSASRATGASATLGRAELIVEHRGTGAVSLAVYQAGGSKVSEFRMEAPGRSVFPLGRTIPAGRYYVRLKTASGQETVPASVE